MNSELVAIRKLEKQILELMDQIKRRGLPTRDEARKMRQLWIEYQAKCLMFQGMSREDAYKKAEENIWLLERAMDEILVE
jgi:hypothetical protein